MSKSLRVLMLENSEADAELIKHELSRAGLAPVTKRVDTEEAFASAIPEFAPDIVLLDPHSAKWMRTSPSGFCAGCGPSHR